MIEQIIRDAASGDNLLVQIDGNIVFLKQGDDIVVLNRQDVISLVDFLIQEKQYALPNSITT